MYKVAVIIPVYNVAQYLQRCIDSLLAQTLEDIEFIFVDDASTDNSVEILQKNAPRFRAIQIHQLQDNCGAAYARNIGLKHSYGEYIGFIDPDDIIEPDFFKSLYNKAIQKNSDIVKSVRKNKHFDGKIIISNLNKYIKLDKFYFNKEWTTAIYKKCFLEQNNIYFNNICTKAQDTLFLFQCICRTDKIDIVNSDAYIYIRRKKSLNSRILNNTSLYSDLLVCIYCIDEFNIWYSNNKDKKRYIKFYNYLYSDKLIEKILRNFTAEGMQNLSEAFINGYTKCKEKKLLDKKFKYKKLLSHIKNGDVNILCDILIGITCEDDLRRFL